MTISKFQRPTSYAATWIAIVVISMAWLSGTRATAATLMRFPNASANQIAFVARGELWTAPLAGGRASRLTHDPGGVAAPRFSPDGRWIAFTGRRAKGRDVYVIAATGGEARRLTFDGPGGEADNLVLSWTPDSRRIVFLSGHGASNAELFRALSVPVEGGQPERLPLDRAGLMSFSPDGGAIAFNRTFRNFKLRKRYVGGQQQDIYTYDFGNKRLTRITDWKGTDTSPMWSGRKIYFLSDRGAGFRANIWVYDLDTRLTRQLTRFTDYDVDWPTLGAGGITFQQGGQVYAIDLPSEHLRKLRIEAPDTGERTAPREVAAGDRARVTDALGGVDYSVAPDGSSLLISARGDIVRVPAHGAPVDLTQSPGVDEDHPSWSPDGRLIAYTTDANGEQQVAVRPASNGPERVLTHSHAGYFYTAAWSPAGNLLAVADANHGLWLIPTDRRSGSLVARDPYAEIRDAAFSPDGRWLAYSTQRSTRLRAIHLREIASGRDVVVSSPMESDRLPVFTPDRRYLAFVSQRNELPFVSDRDDENLIVTVNSDGVYVAPLSRSDAPPAAGFAPGEQPAVPVRIDLEGLMSRAVALPVTPAVITSLEARGTELFYEVKPPQLIGGDLPGARSALHAFDLQTFADRKMAEGLNTHSLSADGATVAFRRDGGWSLASTRAGAAKPAALDLSAVRVRVDPRREWPEMLQNAWRLDRDVFFSPVMNGTDWAAVHDAYARLWPLIGSQDDFLYLLGQMQGEIASSHTFIFRGADTDPRPRVETPLLGADYMLDTASGRYRIAHIYRGDQSRPELRGPLGTPGLDIREGDFLLAVDGQELRAPAAPMSVFDGLKGPITLTLASAADSPRRKVKVDPVDDDLAVRHLDWVERNRDRVDRLSGGRLGYVALSDFDDEGSKEFVRQFYPQLDKQGLIFDVRWNRGGFTSQAVLDVLRREPQGVFVNRERALSPLPTDTAPRVMTTIINYASTSDGDQFPYYFRQYGLGPLVGERTWGGVQGINGPWRLMDGTAVLIPKDSLADRHGRWLIENEGVSPDLAVDTTPSDALLGRDRQLEAAVHTSLERLSRRPQAPPQAPAPLPAYPAGGDVPGASFSGR